jgi:serine/threonine protein kinase
MEHIPSVDDLQRARPDLGQVEFVASGGFKAVFKATLRGRVEAVKIAYVPPEAEEDTSREEIVARVKREIDALRMCRTNRLVSLGSIDLQMITIGGRDYLIYSEEFLTGETLRVRIRNGYRPNFEELVLLTRCLIEALDAIAQIGHIHRDVKPGNIVATGDRERPFVLLDLGIAYKIHGTELTARGGPPGTLLYIAPELFHPDYKSALDIRSDVYSAGVTIFEYATGAHPLARPDESEYTTVYRIVNHPPTRLAMLRSDLPEVFCRLVDRCVKKFPALRYPNPRTLLQELEEIE